MGSFIVIHYWRLYICKYYWQCALFSSESCSLPILSFSYYFPNSFSYFLLFLGPLSLSHQLIPVLYLHVYFSIIYQSYSGRVYEMIRLILIIKEGGFPKKAFIHSAEFLPLYFSFKDDIWKNSKMKTPLNNISLSKAIL